MMSIGWSTVGWDFIVFMRCFGDVVLNMGSRQRYNIWLFILPVTRHLVNEILPDLLDR